MDEAAANMRFAMYSMPSALKRQKLQLAELVAQEEQAWAARDYENAAQYKTERVRLEEEYNQAYEDWREESDLDDMVDASDIAEVVQSSTGIPVSSMMQAES